ncbi:hypothetical protein FisN_17Hu285 [Fistulifera solaris]|jgi:hypothetical protein|uniref:Uncharacterized protein n=1 Tax=Fistulifera solaris TaxID=1519565 RepID=A0A1Z5JHI5_FISSO|nr:hypothetical protein FisN_17Hu285 [Fistulifera solaris]|eukprot:GAX13342.1 hypothetical protein FisN_17Hu285 [Fistulifera solaris]
MTAKGVESAGSFTTEEADDGTLCANEKVTKPVIIPLGVDLSNGEKTTPTEPRRSGDPVSKPKKRPTPEDYPLVIFEPRKTAPVLDDAKIDAFYTEHVKKLIPTRERLVELVTKGKLVINEPYIPKKLK